VIKMVELTKEQMIIGFIVIATGLIGTVLYTVYDTGEELTCGTNKPDGWVIDDTLTIEGVDYYSAHCPYKTKDWTYANCSSFRSTASYSKYGCHEVIIITEDVPVEPSYEEKVAIALDKIRDDCNPYCKCDLTKCYGNTKEVVI